MDCHHTYSAFFDFYLSEHSRPLTRALHYVGSTCGIAALIATITTANPLWMLAGLLAGYGCAWVGHFFVEHNKPTTFSYPLWSFIGDYHMFFLWLTGQLTKRRAAGGADGLTARGSNPMRRLFFRRSSCTLSPLLLSRSAWC